MKKIFSVVGEDARQQAAGQYLREQGFGVVDAGQVSEADYLLLPMSMEEDEAALTRLLGAAKPGALAFGGRVGAGAQALARAAGIPLDDYYTRPELIQLNAVPTAEGCIQLLMEQLPCTLWDTAVLVLGYGRCGRATAQRLAALGARAWVAARSPEALAQARTEGLRAFPLEELSRQLFRFRAVVNTVPAMVLPEPLLAGLEKNALVVDLASRPGGVDFAAAKRLGIRAVQALGLPGRCAPETAGRLTAAAVLEMLREKGELQ